MQSGFNRVEILVLAAVIITLVVIFLLFVLDIQKSIRDTKRRGDIETMAAELEVHINRQINQFCKGGVDSYCALKASWFTDSKIPADSLTGESYLNLPQDGYKSYSICAKLEKGGQYCQRSQQ